MKNEVIIAFVELPPSALVNILTPTVVLGVIVPLVTAVPLLY
jgi:hypothetical protein